MARVRGDLELTQEDLADQVFGNRSRDGDISKLENGNVSRPQQKTIAAIAGALGIDNAEIEALRHSVQNDAPEIVQRLLALIEGLGEKLKLSHALVVALAYNYGSGSSADFDSALRDLENALRIAAADRAKLSSNLGEAVNQVIARVNALNDAGDLVGAGKALKAALAAKKDRMAEEEQGYAALLAKGVAQAVLERSVPDAVDNENEILRLDEPDNTLRFWARQKRLTEWYQRGRSRGFLFDLEVATSLAQENIKAAQGEQQVGAAWDDFGTILLIIGDLKGSGEHYSRAMKAYERALLVTDQVRNLNPWLVTFNNFAISIRKLGTLREDQSLLEKAASNFNQLLKFWTRSSDPRNWARARNNLGIALADIGELAGSAFHLQRAVEAFQDALSVWTVVVEPIDWPAANRNLGHA